MKAKTKMGPNDARCIILAINDFFFIHWWESCVDASLRACCLGLGVGMTWWPGIGVGIHHLSSIHRIGNP